MTEQPTANKIFRGEIPGPDPDCKKCDGKGHYAYDDNHGKICEACCPHDEGFWKLEMHYGEDNGKLCCRRGCGFVKDEEN